MNDVATELKASKIPLFVQPFILGLCMGEGGIDENAWRRCYGGALYEGPLTAVFDHEHRLWGGKDNSHALGAGQFQPGTYEETAQRTGLPTLEPQSQLTNIWDLAQHVYELKTKRKLDQDLRNGLQVSVWETLKATWTSLGLVTRTGHYTAAVQLLGGPVVQQPPAPTPQPDPPTPAPPQSPADPVGPADPEILALGIAFNALKGLAAEARTRVYAYLCRRLDIKGAPDAS